MRAVRLPATLGLTVAIGVTAAWAGAPADRLPAPKPEPCKTFDADPAEGEFAYPDGLSYEQVTGALDKVIQTALRCPRPAGATELHLTYELVVGCDGIVRTIETVDDGGAPAAYAQCISDVVKKADFPAHDMPDGMTVTYPVTVAW
jgi:hypothetical protein